jgi:hypothetical protein
MHCRVICVVDDFRARVGKKSGNATTQHTDSGSYTCTESNCAASSRATRSKPNANSIAITIANAKADRQNRADSW